MRVRRLATALIALVATFALAACGSGSGGSGSDGGDRTTLTVLAAASLTDAFGDVRKAYEQNHPDIAVRFSFEGSQQIAAQVRQGAPADVVAMANQQTMDSITRYVDDPQTFATNRLAIVVGKGNPKHISGLADLARPDLTLILAAPSVPAGNYARQVLARAHVRVHPKSEATDVRAVLTPVRLGEADAGIVYATDIADAGGPQVQAVAIPRKQNVIATYPVAAVKDSAHPAQATAFAAWLQGTDARGILRDHGFGDARA